jgi:hypothetical protein
VTIQLIGAGRHRRQTILERVADRPVAALLVAAGTGFAAEGTIAFLRLVF